MKKSIICNLILFIVFSPPSLASPVFTDDPSKFVRLSDGRQVEFGQGVICSDDCVSTEIFTPPDDNARRRWMLVPFIGTAIVLCAVLCRGGSAPPTVTPNPPGNPTPPTPPPPTEIPEPLTVATVSLGLAMIAALRKRA